MDVRPGYKRTPVGMIPEDWELELIVNLAHISTGGRNTKDRVDDGEYPFFVRSQIVEHINSYSFDGEAVLTAGDGVGTGKVFHYINGKFDVHQRVYRISDYSNRINGYFFYLYFSSHFYGRIMQMTAKSSVDSVRKEMIAGMLIPFPNSLAEQEAIADALTDADTLIESLEQLLTKKRQIKKGAMQELLTGKKRLPGFSGEWHKKRLGDFAPLQRGFDLPNRHLRQGPYPVVYSNGVMNYHSSYQVTGPGVVTGRSGTIGNVTFVEGNFWPHNTALWVTSFKGCNPKFVYFLYAWVGLERFTSGSGVPTLNRNDAHDFDLLIPPTKDEQTAISTILSDMDAEIAALESRLSKARQLKQGMMQELLSGRIRLV